MGILTRARNTASTQRRCTNLRTLIDEFAQRNMTLDDMSLLMKFSPSGTRKYLRDLRNAEVVLLVRESVASGLKGESSALYGLSPDTEKVLEFIRELEDLQKGSVAKPKEKSAKESLLSTPGRRIHIMIDDAPMPMKRSFEVFQRDELTLSLFGTGRAPSQIFAEQQAMEDQQHGA